MNEIKILGISGKKQSGKNTAANYIVGVFLKALKITKDFEITDKGNLLITDIFGNEEYRGIMDINSQHPAFLEFAEENIFPFVKIYSYADSLKQKVCIDILGLTWQQCYGTDEDKDSLTHLRWENMPGIICECLPDKVSREDYEDEEDYKEIAGQIAPYYNQLKDLVTYHKPGQMTAREVMQYVGTEIFRKMYGDVWVNATINQIKKDQPTMSIIADVRFENEANILLQQNVMSDHPVSSKIIRLKRDIFKGKDQHASETGLDNFDQKRYDLIIDNQKMSITEQNKKLHDFLAKEKWIPHEVPEELIKG